MRHGQGIVPPVTGRCPALCPPTINNIAASPAFALKRRPSVSMFRLVRGPFLLAPFDTPLLQSLWRPCEIITLTYIYYRSPNQAPCILVSPPCIPFILLISEYRILVLRQVFGKAILFVIRMRGSCGLPGSLWKATCWGVAPSVCTFSVSLACSLFVSHCFGKGMEDSIDSSWFTYRLLSRLLRFQCKLTPGDLP